MSNYDDFYTENDSAASITLGSEKLTGHFTMIAPVRPAPNRPPFGSMFTVDLDAMEVTMGGDQSTERMRLGLGSIVIDAKTSTVTIDGTRRNAATFAMRSSFAFDVIHADAETGTLSVGNSETSGRLKIRGGNSNIRAILDAVDGLTLKSNAGADMVRLNTEDAHVTIGGVGQAGTLSVCDSGGQTRIEMTGQDGDIRFAGADLAEEFTVAHQVLPLATAGMVMVLDDFGTMTPCTKAYDQRVVGVIAGAGDYRPAMILDRQDSQDRRPVAMVGKVSCFVSAKAAPVRIGDLLTTSDIAGYAQVATQRNRAFGCVIGKALGSLESGSGLIPVLVNLQ